MQELIDGLNIAAVAGSAGGIVRYSIFHESRAELLRNIVSGGITAHYMSFITSVGIMEWLGISELPPPLTYDMYTSSVAFSIGFFGAVFMVYLQEKIFERTMQPAMDRSERK